MNHPKRGAPAEEADLTLPGGYPQVSLFPHRLFPGLPTAFPLGRRGSPVCKALPSTASAWWSRGNGPQDGTGTWRVVRPAQPARASLGRPLELGIRIQSCAEWREGWGAASSQPVLRSRDAWGRARSRRPLPSGKGSARPGTVHCPLCLWRHRRGVSTGERGGPLGPAGVRWPWRPLSAGSRRVPPSSPVSQCSLSYRQEAPRSRPRLPGAADPGCREAKSPWVGGGPAAVGTAQQHLPRRASWARKQTEAARAPYVTLKIKRRRAKGRRCWRKGAWAYPHPRVPRGLCGCFFKRRHCRAYVRALLTPNADCGTADGG